MRHHTARTRKLIHQRAWTLIALALSVLLLAQPLLVEASPAARARGQLAGIAQQTAEPAEDPTEIAGEDDNDNDSDNDNDNGNDDDEPDATAVSEEVTGATPVADQINIELPTDAATDTITIEVPLGEQEVTAPIAFPWQGPTTINASELGEVAAPLRAEVLQGDFEISYVAAPAGSDDGNLLRILPVSAPATLRFGLILTPDDATIPFPAGATIQLQLSARVYAPDATARLIIADDRGSSSLSLDGLNWTQYEVTREIAAAATAVELLVEWRNVPANGWLEVRDLGLARVTAAGAALSPTDVPALLEAVTIAPTEAPPTSTSSPAPLATVTPLPTATPVPGTVTAGVTATAGEAVTASVPLTPTPTLIIVTSTPTPADIFEEATRVAQATEWARILGPATATPPNLATPTPTVTPLIIVLVNTPTPENAATATHAAIFATAVAFTTGTPTPYPPEATIAIATATPPPPTRTPRPTSTPTPIFVLLDDIPVAEPAPTPLVPASLYGKIIFLTDFRGDPLRPNAMIMNPDGTEVGLMTTNAFYNFSNNRDKFSADRRYRVYNLREDGGEAHNAGRFQLFYDDYFYNSFQHQLTYFGAGVAWSPAWSPTRETIAFVSSETHNDEIWIMERGNWPARQLTKNDWEWDHHPSFSPDGSEIVFSSNRETGRRQIWVMSSSGENVRQLTNFATFEAWDPVWIKYVEGQ